MPDTPPGNTLLETNRRFYDALWHDAQLVGPERFNTWPTVRALAATASHRLEVAPGLRPRLPIAGTAFLDISIPALTQLRHQGGHAVLGLLNAIPFPNHAFDLVCACDVIEHVEDDAAAFAELARVATPGAAILLSTPIHPELWTAFDDAVGHRRRYTPDRLAAMLATNNLTVEASAAYGMQPRSSRLVDFGMHYLTHHRARAMWWYNRVFMPLAIHFEKKLAMHPGMINTKGVDTVFLLCRKQG